MHQRAGNVAFLYGRIQIRFIPASDAIDEIFEMRVLRASRDGCLWILIAA